MNNLNVYRQALRATPAPGSGCHPHLLRIANIGIRTGVQPEQLARDIRAAIPPGRRHVPDSEINEAISRAMQDAGQYVPRVARQNRGIPCTSQRRVRQPTLNGDALRAEIMATGSPDEVELRESSPTPIFGEDVPPHRNTLLLLQQLYQSDDYLFLGEQRDSEVKTMQEWYTHIDQEGTDGLPHIMPNPLTGQEHQTKSGTPSYRCDAAVKEFRFAVCEFDNMSNEDQLRFWSGWIQNPQLPRVACLIDSGNKSIHAWLEVNCPNCEAWERDVEQDLFPNLLVPVGVDPACRNEARMSRLPGHGRQEYDGFRPLEKQLQKLLWLNTPAQTATCINDVG